MHMLALTMVNLHNKFEMSSFTHSEDLKIRLKLYNLNFSHALKADRQPA